MPTDHPSYPGPADISQSPYAFWIPLKIRDVSLKAGFWAGKQALIRQNSLRHAFNMFEKSGHLHNLRLAAGLIQGQYKGRNFLDSEVYKWLEAMAWELGNQPDVELQGMADQVIHLLAMAQLPDGYLNSYYQIAEPQARWADLDHGHELYCAGHLFQAAVAFQRAMGDERLLEISCRFADHIDSIFGPHKRQGACGHPEVEMALIELYRSTRQVRYLDLAKFFIDQRGKRQMVGLGPYGPEYHQDHLPVREVTEATGHTVRQLYLAAGVTDLYLETGEQALFDAMLRLSDDIVSTKLYITGGLGARFDGESFGDPYELPSDQSYCEACTAIASVLWNWRMLLATGEARFADQMERALYNNILASPALDGKHFFYINPLMLREARYLRLSTNPPPSEGFVPIERPEWHDVSCCPPNIMRLLASFAHYLATTNQHGVQIHQFTSSALAFTLGEEKPVGLDIKTDYPWQGLVRLEVTETGDSPWELSLRVPEWSQGATLSLNGEKLANPVVRKGYALIERTWRVGDVIELDLKMRPQLIASNPRIDATRSSLAIQQGPLVYCLEDCDQAVRDGLLDIEIDAQAALKTTWDAGLLGGVNVIEAAGRFVNMAPWRGKLYRPAGSLEKLEVQSIRLVAVPYFAWANRGIGPMLVWIPAV